MSTVTAMLTHLSAEQVHETVKLLDAVSPDARFVICYGGEAGEFERIEYQHKLFISDPTLRGPERHLQSLTGVFEAVWTAYLDGDESIDSLYVIEYDHLLLSARFEVLLRDLAAETQADFMGKNCVDCTATNREHYVRFRREPSLLAHLRRLSVREDPARLFACLGDGMWISRRALQAYIAVGDHPPCYCEVYVPSLLHHLGFRVVDVDAYSDLYRHVRWLPPLDADEVMARFADGAAFIHPVKDQTLVGAIREALLATRLSPDRLDAMRAMGP